MTKQPQIHLTQRSLPLEQVAQFIRRLNRQEKLQLLQLVPELQTLQLSAGEISVEQRTLLQYFTQKHVAATGEQTMNDNAPFIAGLTMIEFFGLTEAEQDRLWTAAHQAQEKQLANTEHPLQQDAIPTR